MDGDFDLIKKMYIVHWKEETFQLQQNRPFPRSSSVRSNNSTGKKLRVDIFINLLYFVHPHLHSAALFVRMREGLLKFSHNLQFCNFSISSNLQIAHFTVNFSPGYYDVIW